MHTQVSRDTRLVSIESAVPNGQLEERFGRAQSITKLSFPPPVVGKQLLVNKGSVLDGRDSAHYRQKRRKMRQADAPFCSFSPCCLGSSFGKSKDGRLDGPGFVSSLAPGLPSLRACVQMDFLIPPSCAAVGDPDSHPVYALYLMLFS